MSLHLKSGSPIVAWTWISQGDIDCMFVRHERGVVSLLDGDLTEASADFRFVIQRSVDQTLLASASVTLGHCFRRTGEFDKAIECYQSSLAYGVRGAEALASIGFTYHRIGDFGQAILYYNTCLSADPVHAFATKMLEIALHGLGYFLRERSQIASQVISWVTTHAGNCAPCRTQLAESENR
jgi:tetratricopeptide (TPR) repeat protein